MKQYISLLALSSLLILNGCGTEPEVKPSQTTESNQYSITDFSAQTIHFTTTPEKIVALSNGDMDIVYALGGHVVGRPTSKGPVHADVEKIEQVGSTHEMDLEKVTYLQPDVVLGHTQMNIKDVPAIQSIDAQMVLSHANSVDDIKKQIELFGDLLQKEDKAKELITDIDIKIQHVQDSLSEKERVRTLLVYGAPGTYMAALSNSLSGNLLELAGGENIASDFPSLEAYPQYAKLNTERIIEANPQYILLMSHGNPEEVKSGFIKEMEQNAVWNQLDAVKNGKIEVLPSDLFGTNPGTRITEAMDYLVTIFQSESHE